MRKIYKCFCWFALCCCCSACTNEDYALYDTGQKDSVFFEYLNDEEEIVTSVDYAFNYNIEETHTIEIPVRLMGMPVDHDRQLTLAPVKEETDMVEGTHYTVEPAVLPANAVKTTVKVVLLRGKDPAILERSFKLKLELTENDDLRSVGQKAFTITYSDIHPTQRPEWWVTYMPLPVYSYESAQIFFKYFYDLAPKANLDVYNEMIKKYGDYFVKAAAMQGPFAMYDSFLKKYVLIPMYEDYKDTFEWQVIPKF